MENTKIIIPYVRSKVPPHELNLTQMVRLANNLVMHWSKKLKPLFKTTDAIKLTSFEKKEDGLHLQYEIVRDKFITEIKK